MKTQALLGRKAVEHEVQFEKVTPSNTDARKIMAAHFKVNEEVVAVRHIYTAYGTHKAEIHAYIYDSKKDFDTFEPKKKEKKAAGQPAPEKK